MSTQTSNPFTVRIVSAIPSWLAMQPNLYQWSEIQNTAMTTLGPPLKGSLPQITAYSGAAWNDTDMLVFGGGHLNYDGNEVIGIQLNADTPVWRTVAQPSPVEARAWNVKYYADGKPSSRHTYWYNYYVPQHNRLFTLGANATSFSDAYTPTPHADAVDVTTGQWDPGYGVSWPDVPFYTAPARSMCMDGSGRIWMLANGRMYRCDTATMAWTDCGAAPGNTGTEVPVAFDSTRNRLFELSTPYSPYPGVYFSLNGYSSGIPPATTVTLTGTYNAATIGRSYSSMIYCPDLDAYLLHRHGDTANKIIKIDAATFVTSDLTLTGTVPDFASSNGLYSRFHYLPTLKCVIFLNRGDQTIKFFRTA